MRRGVVLPCIEAGSFGGQGAESALAELPALDCSIMQPRHGAQQQQDNKPLYGWLWRRLATNSWERFYCRGSTKKITIFADDKASLAMKTAP